MHSDRWLLRSALTGRWVLVLISIAVTAESPVSFKHQIAPILQQKCVTCHGPGKSKGKYRLDTFALLMKGGESGDPSVVVGEPERSKLLQLITANDPDDRMPQKDDPLARVQVAMIERWIREGATFDGGDQNALLSSLIPRPPYPLPPDKYPRAVPIIALAFSPDGRELAVSGYHEVTVWNSTNGNLLGRLQHLPQRIQSLDWHRDGKLLAVAGGAPGQSGEVMLVDSASGEIVKSLATAADCFLSARFSPDGSRLAVSGADNVVRVIDVTSGMETSRIQQHADWVMSVSWSPDGTKLASASRDRTARVYDSTNGELLVSFTEHGSPVNAVVFAADGKSVISADREKNVFIWNVEEGKKQGEFKGFDGEVFQLAVRSGELLSCAVDGKVRLHRLEGRKLVRTNAAAADRIVSLALAPTGGLLAAGAFNGEIHVWTNDSEAPATMFLAAPGLGLSNSIHAHGAESRLNPQGDRKR